VQVTTSGPPGCGSRAWHRPPTLRSPADDDLRDAAEERRSVARPLAVSAGQPDHRCRRRRRLLPADPQAAPPATGAALVGHGTRFVVATRASRSCWSGPASRTGGPRTCERRAAARSASAAPRAVATDDTRLARHCWRRRPRTVVDRYRYWRRRRDRPDPSPKTRPAPHSLRRRELGALPQQSDRRGQR